MLMGLTKTIVVLPTMLSPLGKACARMDLTAVHDILLKTGYKDEEGAENEVSKYIAIWLFVDSLSVRCLCLLFMITYLWRDS